MAHPDEFQFGKFTQDRRRDGGHGVGVAEYRSRRGKAHYIRTNIEDRRDYPQAVEQTAGAAVLPVYLIETVLQGIIPILIPEFEAIPNLY
jgi:hypothetical protein